MTASILGAGRGLFYRPQPHGQGTGSKALCVWKQTHSPRRETEARGAGLSPQGVTQEWTLGVTQKSKTFKTDFLKPPPCAGHPQSCSGHGSEDQRSLGRTAYKFRPATSHLGLRNELNGFINLNIFFLTFKRINFKHMQNGLQDN